MTRSAGGSRDAYSRMPQLLMPWQSGPDNLVRYTQVIADRLADHCTLPRQAVTFRDIPDFDELAFPSRLQNGVLASEGEYLRVGVAKVVRG